MWSFGRRSLLLLPIVICFGLILASFQLHSKLAAALERSDSYQRLSSSEVSLLGLVNESRAENGVLPLELNPKLNQSAAYKAADMKRRNYFGHQDPSDNQNNGLARALELTAGSCAVVSENLYQGVVHDSPEAAVRAWLNSPSHRQAMLSDAAKSIGLAISGNYYVLHFCENL